MDWRVPHDFPLLEELEAHLWLIELTLNVDTVRCLEGLLSREEMARARRFLTTDLYQKFVVTRGRLRQIAGRYVGVAPKELVFSYSEHGKPFVPSSLEFNVSHSHDFAIFAFTRNNAVGVDIEYKRKRTDIPHICKRFFSLKEYQEVSNAPKSEQLDVFYAIWAKKEAYTKAIGGRIFEVLAKFKNQNLHIENQVDLYIQKIFVRDDYAGALATLKKLDAVRCWLG